MLRPIMRTVTACTVLAGCVGAAAPAAAAVNTRLDILVSADGGPFASTAGIWSGGTHHIEVVYRLSYIGNGTPLGLASAVFQPVIPSESGFPRSTRSVAVSPFTTSFGSNTSTPPGVVSNAPGQYGRISPFGSTNLNASQAIKAFTHVGGSGGAPIGTWIRIAQAQVTSWIGGTGNTAGSGGVRVTQFNDVGRSASEPAFNPGLSVDVFRFGMDVTPTQPDAFDPVVLDAPLDGIGNRVTSVNPSFPNSAVGDREVYWWGAMDEAAASVRGTCEVHQGFIVAIPSPPTLVPLMLACGLGRRRR